MPSVETIGGYARIDNFYDKTEEQLRNMAAAGYANPYIGVESGDDVVLKRINKGYTAAQAREQLEEIHELVRCLTNDTIFMNEHASNLFHVKCRIPEAREELLKYIKQFTENSDEKELRQYRERITRAF